MRIRRDINVIFEDMPLDLEVVSFDPPKIRPKKEVVQNGLLEREIHTGFSRMDFKLSLEGKRDNVIPLASAGANGLITLTIKDTQTDDEGDSATMEHTITAAISVQEINRTYRLFGSVQAYKFVEKGEVIYDMDAMTGKFEWDGIIRG